MYNIIIEHIILYIYCIPYILYCIAFESNLNIFPLQECSAQVSTESPNVVAPKDLGRALFNLYLLIRTTGGHIFMNMFTNHITINIMTI